MKDPIKWASKAKEGAELAPGYSNEELLAAGRELSKRGLLLDATDRGFIVRVAYADPEVGGDDETGGHD